MNNIWSKMWLAKMPVLFLLKISKLNYIEGDHFLISGFGESMYIFGTLMRKWELDILLSNSENTLKLNQVFSQYSDIIF